MIVNKINEYLTSTPKPMEGIKEEAGRIAEHIFDRQFQSKKSGKPRR